MNAPSDSELYLGFRLSTKPLGQTLADVRDSHTWARGGHLQHPGLENSLRLPPDCRRKHGVRRNKDDDDDDVTIAAIVS